jgi:predicted ATPase
MTNDLLTERVHAKQRTQSSRPLRITRLKLQNWRNFRAAEVFMTRRAFFVGPNASGKSNLLDALRFLRDLTIVGGGFRAAVKARSGVSALRCLAAGKQSNIIIEVEVGTDDNPKEWTYLIDFEQDNNRNPLVRREIVYKNGGQVLSRPDNDDEKDEALLSQTHIEQINSNRGFRELGAFFSSVRYLHLVPQLVREPDRSVGRVNDPYGGDFLERVASTTQKTRDARLRKIQSALKVAVPQLVDLELHQDTRGFWHIRAKYEHWRAKGAWQGEEQFSDGTLRLLGVLWSMFEGEGPLLLEEPEMSLNQGVIRYIPSMLNKMQRRLSRQVIVTTHSDALLNNTGVALKEVHLIVPTKSGSEIITAESRRDISSLVAGGMPIGQAVLPVAEPRNVTQLDMFNF